MVFDPWIGNIVSIPCLQGRCKRDPGVPGVWRQKTPNPGVEKRDPGVESLILMWQLQFYLFVKDNLVTWWRVNEGEVGKRIVYLHFFYKFGGDVCDVVTELRKKSATCL